MNHARLILTAEPNDAKLAAELHELDGLALRLDMPLLIGAGTADACIERWGRLPVNCEVFVVGAAPVRNMPAMADLLPAIKASLTRTALDEPHQPPSRHAAQWKRERYGRR